jgi:hypothetical protein
MLYIFPQDAAKLPDIIDVLPSRVRQLEMESRSREDDEESKKCSGQRQKARHGFPGECVTRTGRRAAAYRGYTEIVSTVLSDMGLVGEYVQ